MVGEQRPTYHPHVSGRNERTSSTTRDLNVHVIFTDALSRCATCGEFMGSGAPQLRVSSAVVWKLSFIASRRDRLPSPGSRQDQRPQRTKCPPPHTSPRLLPGGVLQRPAARSPQHPPPSPGLSLVNHSTRALWNISLEVKAKGSP